MYFSVKSTQHTQMIDITDRIQEQVENARITEGVMMVFIPHTTAAVTINENADPSVPVDLEKILERMIPWKADYSHMEGNSAAHAKSSLFGASEIIAVENGRLVLGTWQSIFFCEFDGPRTRKVYVRFIYSVK